MKWSNTLIMVVVASVSSGQSSRRISPEERNALVAFYNATDGNKWIRSDRWLGPPGTECDWYGVTCGVTLIDNKIDALAIKSINLRNNNLKGDITSSLSSMKNINYLALDGNMISGHLGDVLTKRWDAGQIIVFPISLVTSVDEVLLYSKNPSLACSGYSVRFYKDGSVSKTTIRSQLNKSEKQCKCVRSIGVIDDFARLGRFLESWHFSDDQSVKYGASDVEYLRIKWNIGDIHRDIAFDYGPVELSKWIAGTVVKGVLLDVMWTNQKELDCAENEISILPE